MIEKKTLLIIGAGSSVPYGYPTGAKLRNELCDPENLPPMLASEIRYKFCEQFRLSQIKSIDAFLAKRGNDKIINNPNESNVNDSQKYLTFGDVGKLAIAHQLLKCEKQTKSALPIKNNHIQEPEEDHWLQELWHHMIDVSQSEFSKNQLKIISFNYDRVIDTYFQDAIKSSYGIDSYVEYEATKLRKSIQMVNIYGKLQELDERRYGENTDTISNVAECIKVIPEIREENDEQFQIAQEMIQWAEKICFIGFGFDKTNVRRLGFPNHDLSNKKIYATQCGMTTQEILYSRKLLGCETDILEITLCQSSTLEYFRSTGFFFD